MRISVKPGADTRLPLIQEIPAMRLARLEGNNGIGKTLTIRLLQICTGRTPFVDHPLAWRSFCARIGSVSVTVEGLEDGTAITWTLRPESLNTSSVAEPADDWFEITIDGGHGTLAQVRTLLGVERLAGDQGLSETFAQQVAVDEAGVSARVLPLVAAESSPLADVQNILDEALETGRRVSGPTLLSRRKAAERAKQDLGAAREVLRNHAAREQALREAWELQMRVQERERVGEGLEKKLQEFDRRIDELKADLQTSRTTLEKAQRVAAQSAESKRLIANARKREKRRSEEASQLREDLARLRVVADVPEDEAPSAVREALNKELADLQERRVAIDAVPLMRGVTGELVATLRQAEEQGLGRQSLVEGGETIAELRQRLEQRLVQLRAASPSSEGAALLARMNAVRDRLTAIDELLEVSESYARVSRLGKAAHDEIEKILSETTSESDDGLEEATKRVADLDALLQETSSQRTALKTMANEASTGETPQQMQARLRDQLRSLAVTSADLEGELAKEAARVREVEVDVATAEDHERAASREATALERDFERSLSVLSDPDRFAWLAGELDPDLLSADAPLEERLTRLGSLVDRLETASSRANRVRGQAQGVQQALRGIKESLQRPRDTKPLSAYHESLLRGYESEFKEVFQDPRVSELLLGTGSTVDAVSLSPSRLAVQYHDAAGTEQQQPLDAFSRGQQAFAYTKARLATLDALGTRPKNRLVALDEFGAFIARDRLGELIELLADRVATTPGEQILLILPASTDYEGMARVADEPRATELREYARQIAEHGFVFEGLATEAVTG